MVHESMCIRHLTLPIDEHHKFGGPEMSTDTHIPD